MLGIADQLRILDHESWTVGHPDTGTVFLHSCSFLHYAPLHSNETSLHWHEGRFCHLLYEKRGLLEGLSGDEKGG